MITWMQRHKKYLVITIWISTIAFVGAGFVGWGAYDMNNNRAKSIAKVGHRNIPIQEFSQSYNEIYNYYAAALQGNFSQEKADEIGLEGIVLEILLQNAIFLNYADDLGLKTSDQELIAQLINDEKFHKDGKFDKTTYESVLKRARISSKNYENSIKDKILLQKLFNALSLNATDADLQMLNSAYFMRDNVSARVINAPKNAIKIDENELKSLWEKNKDRYKTQREYVLQTKFIKAQNFDANESVLMEFYQENRGDYRDSDDKLLNFEAAKEQVKQDYAAKNSKKTALEEYLKIKKNQEQLSQTMTITDENSGGVPIDEIKNLQVGDTLKPFEYNDGFLIVKLKEVVEPKNMSFDEAKSQVKAEYENIKIDEMLVANAKKALENFKGKNIGFVTKDSVLKIDGLNEAQNAEFLSRLFNSKSKKGYEIIDQKAIVYEIVEQDLLNPQTLDDYKELLTQSINNIKNTELKNDLLSVLQERYKVELYIKGDGRGN